MVHIIVAAHGSFAKGLVESAQLIVGEQEGIEYFEFNLGESIDELRENLAIAIDNAAKTHSVLVLTDLPSGSPFNAAASLMEQYEFAHVTGINMPVFLEILTSREDMSVEALVEMAVEMAQSTVFDANKYIKEMLG